MIRYTEKGIGQHAAVKASGHWLANADGTWQASDEAAVQAILDAYTLADCQADIKAKVDMLAAEKRNAVVAGTSPAEMAKWQEKYRQAAAYQASGSTADCPDLVAEAAAREITLDALCAKVVGKARQLSALEAQIAGVCGRHQDAISAMTDYASALAYDYSTGWPV